MSLEALKNMSITDNTVTDAGQNGIEVDDPSGATFQNITITGNTVQNPSGDGVFVDNAATHVRVAENTISDVGGQRVNIGSNATAPIIVNGRHAITPTLSLGGSNGEISPTDHGLEHYHLKIDAGGSNSILQGINALKDTGVRVTLIHTGGETVTVSDDNTNASSGAALKNQAGSDITLDANNEMVQYEYSGSEWREVYNNIQA